MHVMQLRVERDPITGRDISKDCWNGRHQKNVNVEKYDRLNEPCCVEEMCKCLCHERVADAEGGD